MEDNRDIKNTFDRLLATNDTVFIVPHDRPDFDAIGAAIGISLICKKFKKKCYIVIDDPCDKLETETRKVIEDIKEKFEVIKADEVPELLSDKSLMVAVDVNKDYLVSTKPYLNSFNDIIIVDHHKKDENTIKTPYLFIDEKLSSTCEEIARLVYSYGIRISPDYANYLLAGILLDTNKLLKNTGQRTYAIASKLAASGASPEIANNMFLEDFEHDRAIRRLVDNTDFPTYTYAIASDIDESGKIYDIEDIAKTADYLLKFRVNATFAIAFIDEETISISARSKGIIDVSAIMKLFGGGGNEHSAAAKIKGKSISEVKSLLSQILIPSYLLSEDHMKDGKHRVVLIDHDEESHIIGLENEPTTLKLIQ